MKSKGEITFCMVIVTIILVISAYLYLTKDCCVCGGTEPPETFGGIINIDCCVCPPHPDSEVCFHNPKDERCNPK